jgi:hypothetical protein
MLPDLKKDADGGLTIILQMASSVAGLEDYWLPVPDEPSIAGCAYCGKQRSRR